MFSESNTGSPKKQTPKDKQVDFKEIIVVLNSIYGGLMNIENKDSCFPLQQKLLLCSLMLILNKGRNKDVNIGRVIIRL